MKDYTSIYFLCQVNNYPRKYRIDEYHGEDAEDWRDNSELAQDYKGDEPYEFILTEQELDEKTRKLFKDEKHFIDALEDGINIDTIYSFIYHAQNETHSRLDHEEIHFGVWSMLEEKAIEDWKEEKYNEVCEIKKRMEEKHGQNTLQKSV